MAKSFVISLSPLGVKSHRQSSFMRLPSEFNLNFFSPNTDDSVWVKDLGLVRRTLPKMRDEVKKSLPSQTVHAIPDWVILVLLSQPTLVRRERSVPFAV
jgi:hypothetical protein